MRFQRLESSKENMNSGVERHRSVRDLAMQGEKFRKTAVELEDPDTQREIAEVLQRIMAHELMRKSPKLQAFLTYVVDETLAGRGERLKAYSIAIAALGKHTAFDPALDPIVRVEASRLRRALNAYYASDGKDDQLRITMPTGSYRPIFERSSPPADVIKLKLAYDAHNAFAERARPAAEPVERNKVIFGQAVKPLGIVAPSYKARSVSRLILIANLCMMSFMLIFGTKILFDINNINKRMDQFQAYWSHHLTAQVE